jgi:hypothetical protein
MDFSAISAVDYVTVRDDAILVDEEAAAARKLLAFHIEVSMATAAGLMRRTRSGSSSCARALGATAEIRTHVKAIERRLQYSRTAFIQPLV